MGNDRPGENVVLNETVVDSEWHFNSNQSLIPSTDVPLVQLTLTVNMIGAQAVQTSDTVNNSPIHDYSPLVHHNYSTYSVVFCYYYFCCATFSSKYCVFVVVVVVVFFCSICSGYNQLFIRYLTSTFSYIKFECFSLYFKSQVLLVDTNTGTPLPFGTLGIHKVLALTVVVGLKKLAVPYIIS